MTPARHFLAAMRKRSTLSRPFASAARDLAARRRSAHSVAERPRESALLERAGVGLHIAAAAPQLDPEPVRRAVRGRHLDDAREVVRVGRRVVALDHLVGAAVVRLDRAARVVVGPVRPLATGTEVPGVLAVAVGPLGRLVELRPDQGAREAGVVAHYLRLGIGLRPGARGRRRRGRLRGRGRLLLAVLLLLLLGLGLLALLLVVGGGLQAAGVGVGDSGTGGPATKFFQARSEGFGTATRIGGRPPGGHNRRTMPLTVLIVDDHATFRLTARLLLESEGYDVLGEAVDGADALRAARELSPEVVLLDVQLPDIDGFDVASRLTGSEDGPVVVLTSSRDGAD